MFCPKCADIELETVFQDKLEYLACLNGCEGVWVTRNILEKAFGKKKLKTLEADLEEAKQPDFEDDILDMEKDSLDFEKELDVEDDLEDAEEEEDDIIYEEDEDDEVDNESMNDDDEEDEEEDEVEEVNFGDKRGIRMSFINDDGEYDDPISDTNENFTESTELIEEEDDDGIQIEEEETFFLSSPVSGNPMKRYNFFVNDKIKCSIAMCSESESYWIDGSDEVLAYVTDPPHSPKNFADLLAFDRPEEEIFEDEDEDEDDI